MSPVRYGGDAPRRTLTIDRLVARVGGLPGVRSAGVTTTLPMSGPGPTIHFNRLAYPPKGPDDYIATGLRAVTPGYLPTLRVELRRGRLFDDRDREGAPLVAVVNETMARQFFPGVDPIGQRIQFGTEPSDGFPTVEIVGIVADVRQSFAGGSDAELFLPYAQYPDPILAPMYLSPILVVRTDGSPADLAGAVRAAINAVDPEQPLVNVRTMEGAIAGTVSQPRLQATLLIVFAGVAVALAAVGVYGVMAYTVSQRIPEIGVRLAVGASPARVLSMIVWQGARLALAGLGLGLIAAAFAARAVESQLFVVRGLDPATFAAATAVLVVSALVATYIPARRASRISPLAALGRLAR
jgi:putative ABC transport system permease protein